MNFFKTSFWALLYVICLCLYLYLSLKEGGGSFAYHQNCILPYVQRVWMCCSTRGSWTKLGVITLKLLTYVVVPQNQMTCYIVDHQIELDVSLNFPNPNLCWQRQTNSFLLEAKIQSKKINRGDNTKQQIGLYL